MTPAEEIVMMHREYGHRLYICRAVDRLDRSIYQKVRHEAIKGLFFAALIMAAAILIACLPVHAQSFKQITISWANTNGAADGWPNCNFTGTPAVTAICVEGFTLSDTTTAASPVVLAPSCTATVTANCLSPASTSFIITPLPSVGSHTYSLIANGLNSTGGADNSAPGTVTVEVPSPGPNPPHVIGATLQ